MNTNPVPPPQQKSSLTWLWIVLAVLGGLFLLCVGVGAVGYFKFKSATEQMRAEEAKAAAEQRAALAAAVADAGGDAEEAEPEASPSDFDAKECKQLCIRGRSCKLKAISENAATESECETWCEGPMAGDSHEIFYCLRDLVKKPGCEPLKICDDDGD